MHAGVEASAAYHHTGHLDSVVASAGNTWPVVVLESCHRHEEQVWERQPLQAASREHLQVREHHQLHRRRSHYQRVQVRSGRPE